MKKQSLIIIFLILTAGIYAQTDKDQLALNVARAEDENIAKLKDYIWKRTSNVFIDSELKLTTVTEFKFDADGKLETTMVDAQTTVKKKHGLRGVAQKNAAENKEEYVQQALELASHYAFLSKGELVDFFDKAAITEKDGLIEATASNVHLNGDRLTLRIDPVTNLIVYKEFSSLLGKDLIDGQLNYDKFSNGTVHGTTTSLNLPVEKMKIEALNHDYTVRVQ
ncbi:MAG: hypothetical protein JW731_13350 [Bacteroidales bacterium]|nr:hypothetical protein [Bacteroidales bacterium]